jgi:hypothetical protein
MSDGPSSTDERDKGDKFERLMLRTCGQMLRGLIGSAMSGYGMTGQDLVSAYSKRPDLLVDLDHAAQQLRHADDDASSPSVRSTGRVGRAYSLQDRLTDADMRQIALSFQGGTPRCKIAAKYSISVRSVGRLLRKWRDAPT